MEAPKCKLCGAKHHFREPHAGFKLEPKKEPVNWLAKTPNEIKEAMATIPIAAEVNEAWSTRKHCPTCRCYPMTAAERQKAYRERHKAK